MLIKEFKKVATLAALTVFGAATLTQAADTWSVAGNALTGGSAEIATFSHADAITWSVYGTTVLASSHADQITWPVAKTAQLASTSHADVITWDCPKLTQITALK